MPLIKSEQINSKPTVGLYIQQKSVVRNLHNPPPQTNKQTNTQTDKQQQQQPKPVVGKKRWQLQALGYLGLQADGHIRK